MIYYKLNFVNSVKTVFAVKSENIKKNSSFVCCFIFYRAYFFDAISFFPVLLPRRSEAAPLF